MELFQFAGTKGIKGLLENWEDAKAVKQEILKEKQKQDLKQRFSAHEKREVLQIMEWVIPLLDKLVKNWVQSKKRSQFGRT
eukprot:UN00235